MIMEKKKWKWGILGCGKIAAKFARDLRTLDQAVLYAAASRDPEKAEAFAGEHGFTRACGSYEEMVRDPELDAVYVATPHSHHMEHSLLCLEHHKAVLCEKAFALNLNQAERMIQSARQNQTFLMEAFWTRFQPDFLKMMDLIGSEELGQALMMRSDFAFNGPYDPNNRLYNPDLGGGSLLDIGIYPVFAALQGFGRPDSIQARAIFSQTGSEESIAVIFGYTDGKLATLQSSFAVQSQTQTEFWCEKGLVKTRRNGIGETFLEMWRDGQLIHETVFSYPDALGYHLEAAHVMECLDQGLTESPLLPLSFSHLLMETLDRIREAAGIKFPFEK